MHHQEFQLVQYLQKEMDLEMDCLLSHKPEIEQKQEQVAVHLFLLLQEIEEHG